MIFPSKCNDFSLQVQRVFPRSATFFPSGATAISGKICPFPPGATPFDMDNGYRRLKSLKNLARITDPNYMELMGPLLIMRRDASQIMLDG
jgi:hypothetical protein